MNFTWSVPLRGLWSLPQNPRFLMSYFESIASAMAAGHDMLVLCRAADTCARACGLSTDNTGKAIKEDALGLPVTHSGDFFDHMAVMKAEAIYSAGSGGQMMVSSEQSLPIGDRALRFNRVRARAAKGAAVGPVVVAVSFAGGKVIGDLPPHEAFPIGGTNSVRSCDGEQLARGATRSALRSFRCRLSPRWRASCFLTLARTWGQVRRSRVTRRARAASQVTATARASECAWTRLSALCALSTRGTMRARDGRTSG